MGMMPNQRGETYFDKGEEKYVKTLSSKSWNVGKSEFIDMKDLTKQAREAYEVSILNTLMWPVTLFTSTLCGHPDDGKSI